ncbi:MAG: Glycosyl transferase, group 1 [uncultured bacterium]|nr:MAG: Glycosyl transferase, group 1 [uncultured bacterium]
MKILIDARLYGSKDTGIGRYTQKLVENLIKIDSKNQYIIFLRKNNFESLVFPKNCKKVLVDIKHYSFEEQFKMPFILNKYKVDIIHFPHFNVPLFYFGKYVVTIHDLIMHKFKDGSATTRKFPIYQIWRFGYHLAFAKAVLGSVKVIVPAYTVKDEIIKYYKIKSNKVEVTYEG